MSDNKESFGERRRRCAEAVEQYDKFYGVGSAPINPFASLRDKCRKIWVKFLNFIFKECKIMSGIEEITAKVAELSTVIDAIDVKLDDVKAFIEKLKGSAVTEEQLAELSALVDGVKAQAESVKSEAESLDESAPAPVE